MPRAKTGVVRRRRHNKILNATKGFWGSRSKIYKRAKEAYVKSGEYAFAGRKLKKRDFRSLFIVRINAALSTHNITYSKFINLLNKSNIKLNRKVISDMAILDINSFNKLVKEVSK